MALLVDSREHSLCHCSYSPTELYLLHQKYYDLVGSTSALLVFFLMKCIACTWQSRTTRLHEYIPADRPQIPRCGLIDGWGGRSHET